MPGEVLHSRSRVDESGALLFLLIMLCPLDGALAVPDIRLLYWPALTPQLLDIALMPDCLVCRLGAKYENHVGPSIPAPVYGVKQRETTDD
jgi:hypothetical protein